MGVEARTGAEDLSFTCEFCLFLFKEKIVPVCRTLIFLDSEDLLIHLYFFSWLSFRSPSKNYSYAIKFTTGSAGFNMVRNEKSLGLYKVEILFLK